MKPLHKWAAAFAFVIAAYVAAQLIANVASLRIVMLGPLSIDAGTLIYPLTFTLRDLVQKVAGKAAARAAIIAAALLNLLMMATFALAAALPADLMVGTQETFGELLAPAWRIVIASVIAQVIAELIDTEVYSAWVKRFGERWQWGRVAASNTVSVPIDTAVFVAIAFGGDMPLEALVAIFVSNVILKLLFSYAAAPLIYAVRVPQELRARNLIGA